MSDKTHDTPDERNGRHATTERNEPDLTRRSALSGIAGGVAALGLSSLSGSALANSHTEVWMHPSPFTEWAAELANDPAGWSQVREVVDGLEWHMGSMADAHRQGVVDLATRADLKLGIEVAGPDFTARPWDESTGVRAAQMQRAVVLDPIYEAGGQVDVIHVDGPIKRQLDRIDAGDHGAEGDVGGFDTVEECVDSLVDYVRTIRETYPDIEYKVITNFPNWHWRGDPSPAGWGEYYDVLHTLEERTRAAGVPPDAIMIDNPEDYGGLDRVLDLREVVAELGLAVDMIVNSHDAGTTSDAAFADRSLGYVEELEAHGLDPEAYTVESWYDHPQRNLPETDPTTMAGLSLDVVEAVRDDLHDPPSDPDDSHDDHHDEPGDGPPNGTYRIINVESGKCLDVSHISEANGATIHQWEYVGGGNQHWELEDIGGGEYRLTATHSGRVVDVAAFSDDNGGDIHQWDWHGGDNQCWRIEGLGDGEYRIESVHSGKVLDVEDGSTDNGANVQQWDWHGGLNQRWQIEML